jgi:hypothetical protein
MLNNSQTNNRGRKKGIKENRGWAKEASNEGTSNKNY